MKPGAAVEASLGRYRETLQRVFGIRFAAVLVPPWNRIADSLVPALSALGFIALSTFENRRIRRMDGLDVVDTHIDIMDWKRARAFAGEGMVLGRLADLLARRRRGEEDTDSPIGLLAHHLEHDEAGWSFLNRLLAATGDRSGIEWCSIGDLVAGRGAAGAYVPASATS